MTEHLELMQKAINYADKHQTPFGALVYNGYDSFIASNTSKEDGKVYHAEMNVFLNIPQEETDFPEAVVGTGSAIQVGV